MNDPRSPRAVLESAERRARARLRCSTRSLLGLRSAASKAAAPGAAVLDVVRRHPLLAAALSSGAGFLVASTWRRGTRDAMRRGSGILGYAMRRVLVLSQIVGALRSAPTESPDSSMADGAVTEGSAA